MNIEQCDTRKKFIEFLGKLGEDISKPVFQQMVQKALGFGLQRATLATEFMISLSAVDRWASGQTAPQSIGRPAVARRLITLLQ